MTEHHERAASALDSIPNNLPRNEWIKAGSAAIAAGLDIEDILRWSSGADNFTSEADVRSAFRNIKPSGGIGAGTLFYMAKEYGWLEAPKTQTRMYGRDLRSSFESKELANGMRPSDVWNRCISATNEHDYIFKKKAQGCPLEGLRVVPEGDPLVIQGERMVGALVVPVRKQDGALASLQFITPNSTAEKLKAKGCNDKPNLKGTSLEDGWYTVGHITTDAPIYICEGIGTAWACWMATGNSAVVTFGSGRMKRVTEALRKQYKDASLVLVPDAGKELEAFDIAKNYNTTVVTMPEGVANNFDANDYCQRDGLDALTTLLKTAAAPANTEPRYKLLNSNDLRNLPPLSWLVRGVLPEKGLAALYGQSASGKSFLALDMTLAIAEGQNWFGCRVKSAPVVYTALEGEAGVKLRTMAWEANHGRTLPDNFRMILQPFSLTAQKDISDLAAVVPVRAVLVLDTLNRAAPTSDENSSKDMGEILEAAKHIQTLTQGLVLIVHHSGKNASSGLRGHSSLFAAMDSVIQVARDGDNRSWRVEKSKDGIDGDIHPFKLKIETLGTEETGEAITSCVVERDTYVYPNNGIKLPIGGNQRLVLDAIRPQFKFGESGIDGVPPLKLCIKLEDVVATGALSLTCEPKRKTTRARTAITGLINRGVLGLHDGWVWLKC
jgi:putative DNA primase/helicase